MSSAYRIEKIPNLEDKLDDGKGYRPQLWEVQVRHALRRYQDYFVDEDHRRDWVLAQTEGTARTFLEPSFLSPELNEDGSVMDALDLVSQVVTFLTDPHEQETARTLYSNLRMKASGETFWEFYQQFRNLAQQGGVKDKTILKMDLQAKIPSRLRKQLFHEYRRAKTLEDYVAAVQAEDQGQIVESNYYSRRQEPAEPRQVSRDRRPINDTSARKPLQQAPDPKDQRTDRSSWRPTQQTPGTQNPAQADTPRAQTPANTPRHFSQPPQNRGSTPRIYEMEPDDDGGSEPDSQAVGDNDNLPVEEPTPRAKDQA
jgi:tRNA splicing endonuclease